MAAGHPPTQAELQAALERLRGLPQVLERLRRHENGFRTNLTERLNAIKARIEHVKDNIGRIHVDATAQLKALQQQIVAGTPTDAQLQTLNAIILRLDPETAIAALVELEQEVSELERRVRDGGDAPGRQRPPPPQVGGYLYSKKANLARAKRSATRKKHRHRKHKTHHRRGKKRNRKHKTHHRRGKKRNRKHKTHRKHKKRKRR